MAHFQVEQTEHILRLRFSDAQSANALSLAAAKELSQLIKSHKKWTGLVTVESAGGRMFCSGGQLRDYAKMKSKAQGLKVNREITAVLDQFQDWKAVKLAVVNGDVLGGGMEWLSAFDYRWSLPSVAFGFWQRRIGLSPGWGGGRRWAAIIGEQAVRRALLDSRLMTAPEALRLGWIDRIVPEWKMAEETVAFARRILSPNPEALKSWNVKAEAKVFSDLWLGPAHKAVLAKWKS